MNRFGTFYRTARDARSVRPGRALVGVPGSWRGRYSTFPGEATPWLLYAGEAPAGQRRADEEVGGGRAKGAGPCPSKEEVVLGLNFELQSAPGVVDSECTTGSQTNHSKS